MPESLNAFWNSLDFFQRFLYYIAIPSTLILIIQTVLSIIGLDGHGDTDASHVDIGGHDVGGHDIGSHDAGTEHEGGDHTDGFRVFSIRGIVAFFTIFSWTGIVLSRTAVPTVVNLIISIIAGFFAMLLVAAMFYGISKLQQSGNLDINNAVGQTGTVYLPIPEKRKGKGKVNITIQEQLVELNAQTDDNNPIPTGSSVKVKGFADQNTLIVSIK